MVHALAGPWAHLPDHGLILLHHGFIVVMKNESREPTVIGERHRAHYGKKATSVIPRSRSPRARALQQSHRPCIANNI